MTELITQILEARTKERGFKNEIKKLEGDIGTLEQKIEYAEKTLDDNLTDAADEFVEAQHEIVKAEHGPKIEELEGQIAELQSLMDSKDVEDTEELVQARETREYLNGAAIVINKYYLELKKISTPYFVDLAYNERRMKIKAFRRVFKALPSRIQELEDLRINITQPFQFVESRSEKKGANHSIYLTSSAMSWWVALMTPFAIVKSVRRAKFLHNSASLYHELMHTLVTLKQKSDEEIAAIFGSLLQLKGQKLQDQLEAKLQELESANFDLEEALREIVFDEQAFRRKADMEIYSDKQMLETLRARLENLEAQLESVQALLESLNEERSDSLEVERDSYLKARENREVVLPSKLLYDWTPDSNSYFDLNHGLYLFSERSTVAFFIQMFIFQLRNIMEWGSIQFRILDLLGAEFVSPLMLPQSGKAKAQDIVISTLREEREQVIELMHDLLVRRKTQILATVPNLGDYNLVQRSSGSSPMPYQIIFIVLTDALKMDEKLIQLIHIGEKLGLLVYIFMKDELLTVQLAKSIEPYFSAIVELSDTGLSSYEPETYTEILEQKEADRKARI